MSSTNTDEKESLKNRNSRFLLSFVKQDVQESKVQRRVKTAYAYPDNSNQNGDPDPLKKTIRLESDNLVYCFDVIDDTRNEKVGSLQEFIDKEFDLRFSGCGVDIQEDVPDRCGPDNFQRFEVPIIPLDTFDNRDKLNQFVCRIDKNVHSSFRRQYVKSGGYYTTPLTTREEQTVHLEE